MRRRSIVFLIWMVSIAGHAFAQEQKGSPYLIGGVVIPYQSGRSGEFAAVYLPAPGGITQGGSSVVACLSRLSSALKENSPTQA